MPKVNFQTTDRVNIVGNFTPSGEKAALLLHMMPATKESWDVITPDLQAKGYSVLAIDHRGHGESTDGGRLDYQEFTDGEQQAKILDIRAAHEWLKQQDKTLVLLGGASIGANLVLQYMAEKGLPAAGLMLSPGFNYRGTQTLKYVTRLKDPQRVFLAGAEQDQRAGGYSCAEVVQKLYDQAAVSDKKLFISRGSGHGTDLFADHSDLKHQFLDWL